ncbi:aminotransferase [Ottowia testudinis]|uniref:Aminotransferase n=1 Tax=Ottowia testudinis TaxID=2816950 RepID=A0A975CI47_9BURK|nr:aminotransferase [Ottowia testudinis]QTD46868.1 aminotransferase [Ottowia testudinis]
MTLSSMPFALNPHISCLAAPVIPTVAAWASSYDGRHGPLLGFSQAVPGYPPPDELLTALAQAAGDASLCGYGPIPGEAVLRQAYAEMVNGLYHSTIDSRHVQITAGCNQAFGITVQALAAPGDTVALVEPFYFNHQTTLLSLGLRCLTVQAQPERGFVPDLDDIAAVLRQGVRALVLISPNNPCGAIYPPALIGDIAALCRQHGTWLLVDETYRDFIAPGAGAPHRLLDDAGWQDHIALLYSFSKSFCVPGHRLGALVAGPRLLAEALKIMDNLQICAARAPQVAVAGAIEPLTTWRDSNRTEVARRAAALRSALPAAPGWRLEALGAYFAYVRHPFDGVSSIRVAEKLAREQGVLTVPGEFFGPHQHPYLRVAFANADVPQIEQLPARLAACSAP